MILSYCLYFICGYLWWLVVTCGYLHQLYHKPLVTCDNNVFWALNLFRSLLFPYESCVWILWFWNLRWMQRLYITPCNYLSCSCVKFIDLIFPVLRGAYNSSDRYTFNINVCSWFYMFLYAYNRQINSYIWYDVLFLWWLLLSCLAILAIVLSIYS